MTKCGHDILYSQILAAILLKCIVTLQILFLYEGATVPIKTEIKQVFALKESNYYLLPSFASLALQC